MVGAEDGTHYIILLILCPKSREKEFRFALKSGKNFFRMAGTIMEYSSSMKKIGLIQDGRAVLYCCDEDGNEYVIDELNQDSVFGEPFLLPVRCPALLCLCDNADESPVY